jgi:site-specific recombinase XerC
LARQRRPPPAQIVLQQTRRAHLRSRTEGACPPKTPSEREDCAHLLFAAIQGSSRNHTNYRTAARLLIEVCGTIQPHHLTPASVQELDHRLAARAWKASTKAQVAASLRRHLRWLWENHGAPKLDAHIRRYPPITPRNVTVERAEFERLLSALPDHARLWLLFCSDLAIRAGTAARLGPAEYRPENGTLEFTTKYGAKATLPVTQDVRDLIEKCDMDDPRPFTRQLWIPPNGRKLAATLKQTQTPQCLGKLVRDTKAKLGITKHWTPHDLRRTTAVALYDLTRDLRDVQALLAHKNLPSTIWYLDHRLRKVSLETLELIKHPTWKQERTA